MKIDSQYFGELEISKKDIIKFESGLPGFIEEKEFTLIPMTDTPFSVLQSINTKGIAFVVTDPFTHFKSYEFKLGKEITETLKIDDEKCVLVLTILTVATPFTNTTANLKAPIIINKDQRLGKQIILNDDNYETKHLLVSKLPQKDKGE